MKKALIIILVLCLLTGGGFFAYQAGLVDKLLGLFGLGIYHPLPSQNDSSHVHTIVIDPAVSPTCDRSGLTEGQHCSECGEILVLQQEIPFLGHQYVNNICTLCGGDDHTDYLVFKLLEDDTYMVLGISQENYPVHLVIPSTYLGKSVTTVSGYAFLYYTELLSVSIPDSVTSVITIGPIYSPEDEFPPAIEEENDIIYLDRWALASKEESTTYTLRPGTVGVAGAIAGNSKITDVTIPKSVKYLHSTYFTTIKTEVDIDFIDMIETTYVCSLNSITVEEGNPVYYSKGNCVIDRESNTLLIGSNNSVIPQGITGIGDYAFAGCRNLASITIPDSVTNIGKGAFQDCRNLNSITIPNSVTELGESAFYNCCNARSITLSEQLLTIPKQAFANCKFATSITFGENSKVTTIKAYAFYSCKGVITFTIPKSVESISSVPTPYALKSITVEEGNKRYRSVDNCLIDTKNKSLILGCKNSIIPTDGSITTIAHAAFSECEGLKSIIIPKSVKSIGLGAFYNCSNLADIYYTGSMADWDKITTEGLTNELRRATIHYNYIPQK